MRNPAFSVCLRAFMLVLLFGTLLSLSQAEGFTSRKLLQGEIPEEVVADAVEESLGGETPAEQTETPAETETPVETEAEAIAGAKPILGDANYDYASHLPNAEKMSSMYSRHVEPAMAMAEKHLYPQIQRHSVHVQTLKDGTERLFKEAHGRVTAHLTRLTGHDADLVPEWLQYLSYTMLLFPLLVWVMLLAYFFTQMAMAGIIFTMAKCGNLFWTIYCLFLAIMTFVISDEPLFFFHQSHPSEYVAFQFVKAGLYTVHLLVLLIQCVNEISFLNVVQWMGATLIGVHYYLNAWHPAMKEEPPLLGFKYYAFYMYCFFIFFILPSSAKYLHKYRNE